MLPASYEVVARRLGRPPPGAGRRSRTCNGIATCGPLGRSMERRCSGIATFTGARGRLPAARSFSASRSPAQFTHGSGAKCRTQVTLVAARR